MESKTAARIWNTCHSAKRPWPILDDDDVVDFMIMEAVAVRMAQETKDNKKNDERKNWRNDKEGLDNLRKVASSK